MRDKVRDDRRSTAALLAHRISMVLDRRLPWWGSVAGWVVATGAFVVATTAVHGIAEGDASESVYAAWALAHGHIACGYLPSGVPGYGATAPIYVLASGAVDFVLRIGHGLPFPTHALGANCSTATFAIGQWAWHSGAWTPTLRIGYLGWLVLLAGVVAFTRTTTRGGTGWEAVMVVLVACAPPVSMCLTQYFHPEDLLAMGFSLLAVAAARSDHWVACGVAVALAVLSQQFGILVVIPLFVVAPRSERVRMLGGAVATGLVVALPLIALTAGRAIPSIVVGTGESTIESSLLTETGLRGSVLFALARVLPLAVGAVVAWWAQDRLGARVLEDVPLLSLVATALALRLVFDVELWGYYLMAVSVALVMIDVLRARLRLGLLAWFVLVIAAAIDGDLNNLGDLHALPIWAWQGVLALGAAALAFSPLLECVRAAPGRGKELAVSHAPETGVPAPFVH